MPLIIVPGIVIVGIIWGLIASGAIVLAVVAVFFAIGLILKFSFALKTYANNKIHSYNINKYGLCDLQKADIYDLIHKIDFPKHVYLVDTVHGIDLCHINVQYVLHIKIHYDCTTSIELDMRYENWLLGHNHEYFNGVPTTSYTGRIYDLKKAIDKIQWHAIKSDEFYSLKARTKRISENEYDTNIRTKQEEARAEERAIAEQAEKRAAALAALSARIKG